MNHFSIKNIFIMLFAAAVLSSCWTEYDGDTPPRKTQPGYSAYYYAHQVLCQYTDLLSFVYQFNQYLSQTTTAKRDSVDNLYFRNVKISSEKSGTTDYWRLRAMGQYDNESYYSNEMYDISIFHSGTTLNEANHSWEITAVAAADSTLYHFTVKSMGNNRWEVSENESYSKYAMYYNKANPSSNLGYWNYNTLLTCSNKQWTVQWSQDASNPSFTVSGTGHIESSVATPKFILDYDILTPLNVNFRTVKYNDYDNYRSRWYGGSLKMLVTDGGTKLTEETDAKLEMEGKNDIVLSITYGGYSDTYQYAY